MNKEALHRYSIEILERYDVSRFQRYAPIECVMPGYFAGNDMMFIAQNPGLLKETVEGDMQYLRAYQKKEYDKLGDYYFNALKSSSGSYGTFINDIYDEDWSRISITNVFKCPFKRHVVPTRIPETEKKILRNQIYLTDPKVIVAIGHIAWEFVNGEERWIRSRVIHLQHPSYLRRSGRYQSEVITYKENLCFKLLRHEAKK